MSFRIVKKSNFQTGLCISFRDYEWSYKGQMEIHTALKVVFSSISVEGLKHDCFISIPQLCIIIKECRYNYLTVCLTSMPAH